MKYPTVTDEIENAREDFLTKMFLTGSRDVFVCGMFAGLLYCITHPLEAVKTRVQVRSAVERHRGFVSSLVHIIKHEGKLQQEWGPALSPVAKTSKVKLPSRVRTI